MKFTKLENMKLWEVRTHDRLALPPGQVRPVRMTFYCYIIASDEQVATATLNKSLRNFNLVLLEEMEPTTMNMIGLLYTRYLKVKDHEMRPYGFSLNSDIKPTYFEAVLRYSNDMHLTSTWRRHVHLSKDMITLKDHINENRDRDAVMELAKDRLDIRKKLLAKEIEHLDKLESSLKNLEILPIND